MGTNTNTDTTKSIDLIIDFVHKNTSIKVLKTSSTVEGMWHGCLIDKGQIIVSATSPPDLGDLLHEIGHLASIAPEHRHLFGEELETELFLDNIPRQPSDDHAATFWAFAVCGKIGLCNSLPFRTGYDGDKDTSDWSTVDNTDWSIGRGYWLNCSLSDKLPLGSSFSCAAYYLGLTNSKQTLTLDRWECDSNYGRNNLR